MQAPLSVNTKNDNEQNTEQEDHWPVENNIFKALCVARSAVLSRSTYVARIPGREGTGAEQGGEKRWAFAEYICGTDSWSGRDWCGAGRREALSFRGVYLWHGFLVGEGLVRSREARSAELPRSISVARVLTSSRCGFFGAVFVPTRKNGRRSGHFSKF